MTDYEGLCAAVAEAGLDFAYVAWDVEDPSSVPPLPHALIVPQGSADAYASGESLGRLTAVVVELYERAGDPAPEARLEAALAAAGATYSKHMAYPGAGVAEAAYHTTILGRCEPRGQGGR